ncbi:unnamed protein product, partial [Mesorhabditis spiculigera]
MTSSVFSAFRKSRDELLCELFDSLPPRGRLALVQMLVRLREPLPARLRKEKILVSRNAPACHPVVLTLDMLMQPENIAKAKQFSGTLVSSPEDVLRPVKAKPPPEPVIAPLSPKDEPPPPVLQPQARLKRKHSPEPAASPSNGPLKTSGFTFRKMTAATLASTPSGGFGSPSIPRLNIPRISDTQNVPVHLTKKGGLRPDHGDVKPNLSALMKGTTTSPGTVKIPNLIRSQMCCQKRACLIGAEKCAVKRQREHEIDSKLVPSAAADEALALWGKIRDEYPDDGDEQVDNRRPDSLLHLMNIVNKRKNMMKANMGYGRPSTSHYNGSNRANTASQMPIRKAPSMNHVSPRLFDPQPGPSGHDGALDPSAAMAIAESGRCEGCHLTLPSDIFVMHLTLLEQGLECPEVRKNDAEVNCPFPKCPAKGFASMENYCTHLKVNHQRMTAVDEEVYGDEAECQDAIDALRSVGDFDSDAGIGDSIAYRCRYTHDADDSDHEFDDCEVEHPKVRIACSAFYLSQVKYDEHDHPNYHLRYCGNHIHGKMRVIRPLRQRIRQLARFMPIPVIQKIVSAEAPDYAGTGGLLDKIRNLSPPEIAMIIQSGYCSAPDFDPNGYRLPKLGLFEALMLPEGFTPQTVREECEAWSRSKNVKILPICPAERKREAQKAHAQPSDEATPRQVHPVLRGESSRQEEKAKKALNCIRIMAKNMSESMLLEMPDDEMITFAKTIEVCYAITKSVEGGPQKKPLDKRRSVPCVDVNTLAEPFSDFEDDNDTQPGPSSGFPDYD